VRIGEQRAEARQAHHYKENQKSGKLVFTITFNTVGNVLILELMEKFHVFRLAIHLCPILVSITYERREAESGIW